MAGVTILMLVQHPAAHGGVAQQIPHGALSALKVVIFSEVIFTRFIFLVT
jgi:hypothetical protein